MMTGSEGVSLLSGTSGMLSPAISDSIEFKDGFLISLASLRIWRSGKHSQMHRCSELTKNSKKRCFELCSEEPWHVNAMRPR